jgi:protein associated with RNAse G/E
VIVPEAAMAIVRVVKRKWDGSVSAVDTAHRLAVSGDTSAWLVLAGSRRERPGSGATEVVGCDELWVAVPGEWWVLCGYTDADRSLTGYKVHATAPFEAPGRDDEIEWIDLDLDFDIAGDDVELQDEAQFHDHALVMGYPRDVVRGAWSGMSTIAARYTNGDWPFDGSLQGWVDGA